MNNVKDPTVEHVDGDDSDRSYVGQCATIVPTVFLIRIGNVEPRNRSGRPHVGFHTETEKQKAHNKNAWMFSFNKDNENEYHTRRGINQKNSIRIDKTISKNQGMANALALRLEGVEETIKQELQQSPFGYDAEGRRILRTVRAAKEVVGKLKIAEQEDNSRTNGLLDVTPSTLVYIQTHTHIYIDILCSRHMDKSLLGTAGSLSTPRKAREIEPRHIVARAKISSRLASLRQAIDLISAFRFTETLPMYSQLQSFIGMPPK
ncbi:hypothetical protein V1477_015986 [Vespula maculifrons]